MSSLISAEKAGIRRVSVLLSPIKASEIGSISISEIRGNEKTMLQNYDLFDKELLSPKVKEVKSFKKARRSLFASNASKERKKLEALVVDSSNSRQNGLNTDENKKPSKKINPLKIRISRSSNIPGKLEKTSTICCLSDGNSLVLKNIAVTNELKNSKRQSNVSKKKRATNMVPGKDSDLEEYEKTRKSSFASKERRKLEALDVAFENSRQNVSNTHENQKAEKKVDPFKTRISSSSTSTRTLKRDSTMSSLKGGKSLVLKDTAVEIELKNSNNQSSKRKSYASKKKKATKMVPGKDSDLEEYKKTRKSTSVSKERKTLEALDEASVNSRQNVSNINENKKAREKTDHLNRRISCSITSPRRLKRASTTCSLSGRKSLVLKDIAVENKAQALKKKGKRLSYVSRKIKPSDMVAGKDFDLEEHERMKSASKRSAKMKEINKENYEFETESRIQTISEMERGKRDTNQVNPKSVTRKVPIDFSLEPMEILRSKYKTLYRDYVPNNNDEKALKSASLKRENTEPKTKGGTKTRRSIRIARIEKEKVFGTPPSRRSIRIAAMERNRLLIT